MWCCLRTSADDPSLAHNLRTPASGSPSEPREYRHEDFVAVVLVLSNHLARIELGLRAAPGELVASGISYVSADVQCVEDSLLELGLKGSFTGWIHKGVLPALTMHDSKVGTESLEPVQACVVCHTDNVSLSKCGTRDPGGVGTLEDIYGGSPCSRLSAE
jgi:hypothetical protein